MIDAVHAELQNEPVKTVAGQHVMVRGDDGQTALLPCHRLDSGTDHLLVVVHGALRDADRYFAHAVAAQAGAPALIVAPQFLADVDLRAGVSQDMLYWDVESWKGGGAALGPAPISSFTAMDCLLEQLITPDRPQPAVVIFGNSAGGQYVNRYAAVGRAPDVLARRGISVRFVISNPSTYLYFDQERPVAVPGGAGINRWRYGFEAKPPYVDATARQSLERYLARDVTIVLGSQDRDEASVLLETSAAAMAQGANRRDRGLKYHDYVQRQAHAAGLPTRHQLIELPGVGHAAEDVLAAPQTRQLLSG